MAFALAAGIGGVGSVLSGLIGAGASSQAAKAQQQASMNAIDFQTNLLQNTINANKPYQQYAYNQLGALGSLMTPGNNMSGILSQLPGFQFQSQWGTKTAQNALAAEGLGGSTGPLAKAISDYNNGLAGTYYNNYFNQLMQGVNVGLETNQMNAGQATSVGYSGANSLTNAGNAAASGILGSAGALSNGLTGAAGSASNALLLNSLLNNGNSGIFGGSSGLGGIDTSGLNLNGMFGNLDDSVFG